MDENSTKRETSAHIKTQTPHSQLLQRIHVLDGLRALAIFLVLMRHGVRQFYVEPFMPLGFFDLGTFFMNGWVGVDLFFVLSGFLITSQLLKIGEKSKNRKQELLHFYKKRFFRIAPAFYVVMIIACFGSFGAFPLNDTDPKLLLIAKHVFFLNDYFGSDIVPAFWSLAIELKFYFLAPLLVITLLNFKKTPRIFLSLAALVVISTLIKVMAVSINPESFNKLSSYFEDFRMIFHYSLDGLLAGVVCAFLWHSETIKNFIQKPLISNFLFFAGLASFLYLTCHTILLDAHISYFDKVFLPVVLACSFALMMLGLLGNCIAGGLFGSKILKPVAIISYSLYLVHMLVLSYAVNISWNFIQVTEHFGLQYLIFLVPFLGISTVCACLLYFIIERPFIKWSKKKNF